MNPRGLLLRRNALGHLRCDAAAPPAAPPPPPERDPKDPCREGSLALCLVGAGDFGARHVARYDETRPWPASTDVWCWHCCHPFAGQPLPCPLRARHVVRAGRKLGDCELELDVFGTFCGPPCMNAYVHGPSGTTRPRHIRQDANAVALLLKRLEPDLDLRAGLRRRAPPREFLRAFGGWMTIEEFRGDAGPAVYLAPHNISLHKLTYQQYDSEAQPRAGRTSVAKRRAQAQKQVDLGAPQAAAPGGNFKLKRKKPLQAQHGLQYGLLQRTLGTNAPFA